MTAVEVKSGTILAKIADLARDYFEARERLAETGEAIREEQRGAVRRRLPVLKRRIAEVQAAKDALVAALAAARELFRSPRTRALHGIKVGFRKLPGRIECADEGRAIQRIRARWPERVDELVRVKETLDRTAVRKLTARELAAIGVRIVEVDDEVVVRAAGDDLDKLVDALMADGGDAR